MTPKEEDIARLLTRYSPSTEEEANASQRVYYRLLLARTEASPASLPTDHNSRPDRKRRRTSLIIAVAATAVVSFVLVFLVSNRLWRTPEDVALTQPAGDPIRSGQSVRANGPERMLLALRDGSRVEMRSQSQVQIDGAADGLRIHLSGGSIIVTAAKQGAGHLYVETKDAMVSVIGTVFVVTAEQDGSRVGVIEGVVTVRQGANEKTLFPGQQLATNPAMEFLPLDVQVSWSGSVVSHWALLQRSLLPAQHLAVSAPSAPSQNATAVRQNINEGHDASSVALRPANTPKWEAASIKPCQGADIPPGGRTGGGSYSSPGRLDMHCVSVKTLIQFAYLVYPNGRRNSTFSPRDVPVFGGPGWVNSDLYEVNAIAASASSKETMMGPMLQILLEERFKLKMHKETREIPVYALTVGKNGPKLSPSKEGTCIHLDPTKPPLAPGENPCGARMRRNGSNITVDGIEMSVYEFFKLVLGDPQLGLDRPIVDKTGISGKFDFRLNFALEDPSRAFMPDKAAAPPDGPVGPSIFTAIEELGLKVEATKGPGTFLVIDSIERPAEN